MPALRIMSPELWAAARARQEKTKATFIRQTKRPAALEAGGRLGLEAPAQFDRAVPRLRRRARVLEQGGKRVAKFYCSARQYKGAAGCSNNVGIPAEALDEALLTVLPNSSSPL